VPKGDGEIDERAKRRFRRHPLALKLRRSLMFWLSEALGPIIILDSPLSKIGERASERHLLNSVADPALREKLRPTIQFGCKRMLISDDYWPTFERDNVELVTDAISEVRAHAVATVDGTERAADAIVLATGFKVGISSAPFPIVGRGGKSLDEAWSEGAVAYKGVAVSGFPNWFIIMGPNTGPGHTSVLVYSESQISYILQAIKKLISQDIKYMDVKQAVQDAYNARLQRRMKYTSWSSGCKSWYLSEDGKNHTLFPGFATEYCARIRKFKAAEYHIVSL
jgi:cation diffusion facilitator CzcD-associated flavoprotein CzcO